MKKTAIEILQKIYDSEIHIRIGWMWDGGMDYSIGSDSNDIWDGQYNKKNIVYTGNTDINDAIRKMATEIAIEYPHSKFAEWLREGDNEI